MILYIQDYLYLLLLSIICFLTALRLQMSNNLSVEGGQLYILNMQIHQMQVENMELKDEYLQAASYHTIEQKAYQMGFRKGVTTWTKM